MGVLRIEPARAQPWSPRSLAVIWRSFDLQLTIYALLLTSIGLAMAYSNSVESGGSLFARDSTFVRGLMWAGLSMLVFAIATAFDYAWLKTLAWPIYFTNLGLLAATLVVGSGVGGTARWIPILGLQFQFSELAKILMIVVLANFLASRQGKLDSIWSILGACMLVAPALVLVMLQPDLGTSLVFVAILGGMLFMSGASLRWLGLLAAAAVPASYVAWTYLLRDYQKARLLSFLDPSQDIQGAGYQLYQSQIAVGSGGLFGKGLTNGTQDSLNFLPVQTTDFVFAKLSEELGFLGAVVVFALFVALIWRILVCAWRSRDPFGLLMASGIASLVLFQVVVNVGMVIGVMPITGIPLPFVTHGGASLISLGLGLGILQSINMHQARAEW
ncbi:MAG: rod shape-determining protein RodA [Chloroflexi bacterium]|jgi:rod shape determining protein RodA|nr:MAG: rod shape-determining protein RodA [Chloroflexota bacterium]